VHLDEETLHGYLDHRLNPDGLRRVRRHLRVCPICRSRMAGLQDLAARLAMVTDVPLSRDLVPSVLARLPRRRSAPLLGWMTLAEAAAGVALASSLGPRFVELLVAWMTPLESWALTSWAISMQAWLTAGWASLATDVRSLIYAAEVWIRPAPAGPQWMVALVGGVALLLGLVGNGVLLGPAARRG
jgi:anti-sigma factor RsiW